MARTKYIQITPPVGVARKPVYKCRECGYSAPSDKVLACDFRCPRCGSYFRMRPRDRIALVADLGSFAEFAGDVEGSDPLEFAGYPEKLASVRARSGESEAVVCGFCRIEGQSCGIAVMDSGFMMGSMGYAVGERLSRLFDRATQQKLPVVVFSASGGARMQEGLVSLMQMAKVSCAVQRHRAAGLFYLSVITDPTTGGVTASFATEGDVIISEPKALIGFAGRRVIESTVREELPEGFQTAEFALEHGLIDGIVAREDLRSVISELIALHHIPTREEEAIMAVRAKNADRRTGRRSSDFVQKNRSVERRRLRKVPMRALSFGIKNALARGTQMAARIVPPAPRQDDRYHAAQVPLPKDIAPGVQSACVEQAATRGGADADAWRRVQLARRVDRPTAAVYLDALVDGFLQMHGDRSFADDPAIVAGLGFIEGRPVTVITQEKGANTADRVAHNFGCSHPEGYRKALRLARQAERFGRPVICLVDTQGAHCDAGAEERGQGNAIAECLTTFAGLKVPVISIVLSEGGSGGALALAVGDRIAMMENAVYSILTPEGFASILWKDASRAAEAADAMKPTAWQAKAMGIVDEVIREEGAGAHEHPEQAAQAVKEYVVSSLRELEGVPVPELVRRRQERFSRVGVE